ncbi:phenylalanine--tRNA ligase subunit beta [Candidatus Woesearchaeota archaeon]|nr:MAG: phenylalanyl-tRNA synthetase beta chain [archaeon GW2011_AR4]MBS3129148.1 phenylalanine--tRNA ligase subunit beta [Candidatus Woesearchaeota archaeon]HIH37881.1 phenylalanine--tRNA ligase subunit beta [Candidatus Woesearchaeota archaeon]HIH48854.1 phenylalanine--tRNA ligase subunit beta [Candidatus Woesearchaeota archaeon]HIJ04008.1 phenylalanine--tRNA ligase subunit beta [Candidatus Woesearchaeota archaeon]
MPTVTLNRIVFEKLVEKKLPLEKLKERISYLGTDLESVTDTEITVEIFPNRPDLLSEQGFARAFAQFIGTKPGLASYTAKKSDYQVIIDKSVSAVRPYTACAVIKGLSFDDEKIREVVQIQEKLHITYGRNREKVAIGIYPFEKITLPIHFVGKKPQDIVFQALESPKEMDSLRILRDHKAGREYGHLLEGKERFPVFIDAKGKVLSLPPIINSHETGKITEETRDIFIECSGFSFEALSTCLNILVSTLADMGGQIYEMDLVYPDKTLKSPALEPSRKPLDLPYVNLLLGLSLKEKDAKMYLERMGYGYENGEVLVPCYRADILHQVDFCEDIAIAYGYENFTPVIPAVATIGKERGMAVFSDKIAEILIGLGIQECNTFHLGTKESQNEKMGAHLDIIELANPSSMEYHALRGWMIPSLLSVLEANKRHDYPQSFFDIGTVFKRGDTETGVVEHIRLGVVLCGKDIDFTKIKQVADYLLRMISVSYTMVEAEHPSFIPGRCARVVIGNEKMAYIGEVHPTVLERWGITFPVGAMELNLTELLPQINKKDN